MDWIYIDIPRAYTAVAEWCACLIFIFLLPKRRKGWQIGVIAATALSVQMAFLTITSNAPLVLWTPIMGTAFALMFLFLSVCCAGDWKKKLYYTGCAVILSEAAAALEWLIYYFMAYINGYHSLLLRYGMLAGVYAFIFILAFFLEKRVSEPGAVAAISGKELLTVMIVVVTTFLFSNLSYVFPNTPFSSHIFYESFKLRVFIDILGYIMLMIVQMHKREQLMQAESNALNAALRAQYDKYIHYQDSVEMINMKYHDMKHQIMALRMETDEEKRKKWLDTMENELEACHDIVDSGNKVLDAILENKLSNAKKHQIETTYVIDGKILDFLPVVDLCNIFGNALDNAIEAEIMEPEQEKRMIHVLVSAQRQFVHIKVENYVSHEVLMSGGLPKTTKRDRKNHGYGLKSIQHTVEKYQGNMTVGVDKNRFSLNIIIPTAAIHS